MLGTANTLKKSVALELLLFANLLRMLTTSFINLKTFLIFEFIQHSGSISRRVKAVTQKLVSTAFLLDIQHQSDSVQNKSASLVFVRLKKTLNWIFSP